MAVAGTITEVRPIPSYGANGRTVQIYEFTWLSDGVNVVTEVPVYVDPGGISQVETYPDSGATQPTNLYDLTLLDAISGGVDVLAGQGANLSNTTPTVLTLDPPYSWRGGNLYPTIANAGASNGGRIRIHVVK